MRLFLAVNLPDPERARLHASVACLRDADLPVRWVARDAVHLTLRFLGDVAESRIPAIESVMRGAGMGRAPIRLGLGGVGAFPSLASPRVIWLGVAAPPELAVLHGDLERELAATGFESEARPFHPHLTLGRTRRDARARDFRELARLAGSVRYESAVTVRSVDLMRSHLSPAGARYERIVEAPLKVLERQ